MDMASKRPSHVTCCAPASHIDGKAIEQFAVERFALEFVEKSSRILLREPIVAFANRRFDAIVHAILPDCARTFASAGAITFSLNCINSVCWSSYRTGSSTHG